MDRADEAGEATPPTTPRSHLPARTSAHRSHGLSPPAEQLVQAAAVWGESFSVTDVARTLQRSASGLLAAFGEAEDAGIVRAGGDVVQFLPPWRELIAGSTPVTIRLALHQQVAEILLARGAPPSRVAGHLEAGIDQNADVADQLERAARLLLRRAPLVATELAQRALTLATDADRRTECAVTLVEAHLPGRRIDTVAARAREVVDQHPAGGPATARLQVLLATILQVMDAPAEALACTDAALAHPRLEHQDRDTALLMKQLALLSTADPVRARFVAADVLGAEDGAGAMSGALTSLADLAWSEGRVSAALTLIRAAIARADRGGVRHHHPRLRLALMLVAVGDLDGARGAVSETTVLIDEQEDDLWRPMPLLVRARVHLAAGRPDDAITDAHAGVTVARESGMALFVPFGAATLAMASILLDDLDQAEVWLREATPVSAPLGVVGTSAAGWTAARLARARGDDAGALELVRTMASVDVPLPLLCEQPGAAGWLVGLARQVGDGGLAPSVHSAARQITRQSPTVDAAAAAAAHCAGLLEDDPTALERAAKTFVDPWASGRAHEDAGQALTRMTDGSAAGSLRQALEEYERAGAARDAARVRAQLRSIGVRIHHWERADRPVSGWDSLTEAEERVARVVAEGLTNNQAASRLFLSPHTVDFHLRQIYRKLGVNSRVQLTRCALDHSSSALHERPSPT